MKKNLIILFILVFTVTLFAQSQDSTSTDSGFNLGGGVGSINLNGNTYSRIAFMPEVTFGKIGIGLNIELLIDSEGDIYEKDWDEAKDYLNKIMYLRYGHRGDAVYGKFGNFSSYTLGHGLIMSNYSNSLNFPSERKLGLQLGGNLPVMDIGMEGFTSNISENNIIAGNFNISPLQDYELPIIKNIELSTSFATDRDQTAGITDQEKDDFANDISAIYDYDGDGLVDQEAIENSNLPQDHIDLIEEEFGFDDDDNRNFKNSESDDITIVGFDYTLPLFKSDIFEIGNYAEYAKIIDYGNGLILPGFYSKFLIFDVNLEYRIFGDEFTPAYFDHLYDDERAKTISSVNEEIADSIVIKENILPYLKSSNGWYGAVTSNIFNTLFLTVTYEDMKREDAEDTKSLSGKISLQQKIIPKLTTAEIGYTQRNVEKLLSEFKTPSAEINGIIKYALGSNTQLVWNYHEHYVEINDDKIETIKKFDVGVEFRF